MRVMMILVEELITCPLCWMEAPACLRPGPRDRTAAARAGFLNNNNNALLQQESRNKKAAAATTAAGSI
jgi:hypothetical protein